MGAVGHYCRTWTLFYHEATSDGIKIQNLCRICWTRGPTLQLLKESQNLTKESQAANVLFPEMLTIKMIDSGNMWMIV